MKSLHHSFDIDYATEYGVHEAILIHHFQHWIRVNQRQNRNFIEGRTWSYQKLDDIAAHFPYLSRSDVFELLERLCTGKGRRSKKGKKFEPVLRKGNFNKTKFDKTTWYAFENEEMFTVLAKAKMGVDSSQNGSWPQPTPIPDTIPYAETNPPPPPSSKPEAEIDEPPTKEEEEEIQRRIKERPKDAPKIKSMKLWRAKVLREIRLENIRGQFERSLAQNHRMEAEKYDMQKINGWTVCALRDRVEFTQGVHFKRVLYDISQEAWDCKVIWKIADPASI